MKELLAGTPTAAGELLAGTPTAAENEKQAYPRLYWYRPTGSMEYYYK